MTQWIRWNKNYNYGPGRDEYFNFEGDPTELDITDYISDMYIAWDEGEGYRGFEYELVQLPPEEWLTKTIADYNKRIQSYQAYVNNLQRYTHCYRECDDNF